ncbi:MAG: aminomethyl-transferring glycine dehydrogenase subunit GcvPA [Firmicutes bacterium]|nr:aminomethyl-transferring glycine dehydrogenase subunit GcvPA [Bacillota bacterium]
MGTFIPSTTSQREEMLAKVGVSSYKGLYEAVPEEILLKREDLNVPDGISEMETAARMEEMAAENTVFRTILRGAGSYDHYIPAIVRRVTSKEQFLTAYTPYQAEISQGVLQSIFEYQTEICALTGMDVANASVYDGASAMAEAAAMCRDRHHPRTIVAATVKPDNLETVRTYLWGAGASLDIAPEKDGRIDVDALAGMLGKDVGAVIFEQPNRWGLLEDAEAIIEAVHKAGAKAVMSVNPISLGLLKTPGELGADIAVGEGQPLGMPMGFGGPYLGFMAAKQQMFRKLPGRIVGETTDDAGRRAYVLTLQAREQHIRREKASSNICSNEALCAMTAAAYLAAVGPDGIRKAAELCLNKAHYLAAELAKIGYTPVYQGPFFHEFVTTCPVDADKALAKLAEHGILGGLSTERGILWCCTEKVTKAQIDEAVRILREEAQA